MKAFVIGATGKKLDPTTPRKARILLDSGKAEVFKRYPFTIRLLYKTGGSTQEGVLGIDTGEQHIGIAVTEGDRVHAKYDVELRRSMEKRKLMEARKEFCNGRRYRNQSDSTAGVRGHGPGSDSKLPEFGSAVPEKF